MHKNIWILGLLMLLIGCKNDSKSTIDVSDVEVDFKVDRFDVDFYNTTNKTLSKTKEKYPLFFPEGNHDSIWLNKIYNKDERELFAETQKVHKDFSKQKAELESLFKHIKYYHPKFKAPNIITVLSNIDYDYKVIYKDTLAIISLDVYLGKKHPFYTNFPNYIKQNYHKEHIVVDVANQFIRKTFPPSNERTFLGKMIAEGKKMYLLGAYLPEKSDKEKIGYSKEKMDWALANEDQVWKYFIENNLLYDTATKLNKRFLDDAPFSKFYLSEDNNSPGRIGVWIGWQIVRSYMKHNDVSLQELFQKNSEEIFKKSKYKPKR